MSATKFKIIGKSIKPYLGEGSLSQGIGSLPLWKHIESRLADELTWRCTIEQTMPWVFIDRWSGIEVSVIAMMRFVDFIKFPGGST